MKILVTGGAGFIGSHFVDYAVGAGCEVSVVARTDSPSIENLRHVERQIRLIDGDMNHPNVLASALSGQDMVYHFASATSPAKTWSDPAEEIKHALTPVLMLADAAIRAGVKKFVFPSSGGTVYGYHADPVDETSGINPQSPHAIIKVTIERFLNYYCNRGDLAVDIFRIANVYGRRQPTGRPQGVIGSWMKNIVEGRSIEVYGDQNTLRDYVHVEDVVHLMGHSISDPTASDTYNLGTGIGTSILELLEIVKSTAGRSVKAELRSRRALDCSSIVLDSSKITSCFPGFRFRTLETSLPDIWEWYLKRDLLGRTKADDITP